MILRLSLFVRAVVVVDMDVLSIVVMVSVAVVILCNVFLAFLSLMATRFADHPCSANVQSEMLVHRHEN